MAQNDPFFEENARNAFKKIKIDIDRLDNDIMGIKTDVSGIKDSISGLKEELSKILPFLERISIKQPTKIEESSIGNEGVLNKQTNKQLNKQTNTQQLNTLNELQTNIKDQFKLLSKQEFLTFLTIYQLEEESEIVRFRDVAQRLKLSEVCIRYYVSRLLSKKIPIVKDRINNRIVNLSLLPEFRKLDLKKALTNMYYDLDPIQRNLAESF